MINININKQIKNQYLYKLHKNKMLGLENITKNIFKCWCLVQYLFIGNKNNWIKGGMVVRGMGVVGES